MGKRSITVELTDEIIRDMAVLGKPLEVMLRQIALLAANRARDIHSQGDETHRKLTNERAPAGQAAEGAAGESGQLAREIADEIASRLKNDAERSRQINALAGLRKNTDESLDAERAQANTLLAHQREANEQMVSATILAQEMRAEAEAAKERAELAERELRAVAEFRERFIGILGHDLRHPLGSISMAAMRLRRSQLGERDTEVVSVISRSSQRMSRMIDQMLDLTRARLGGGIPIEPLPTDLRDVLRNATQEFAATVELELEGDLTGIWDQDRLAEVFCNIISNAIEHAAPGTGVNVRARAQEAEVVIEISNIGKEIPANLLPFIFEPFRSGEQSKASAQGHLGLGLYIAKQVVLSHAGTLDVHCSAGTTTFVVRLPRAGHSALSQ